ncbi:MAG: (2Fe-2S)-binding protein [Chloroflexaceae bacterium]|jgi:isoquinoline 1-oxidoreductase alpha subunit|nr:(2Fe-2S)-binding protein [Chloroflexaceae bacterium]
MELNINGKSYTIADGPARPLLWVLRDELGLTGTKFGCGAGYCGSCTVHVEGEAKRSCITPVTEAAGKTIRTIEGLAEAGADGSLTLHPVQQAFLEMQVPQCSWCMSGQMMTAAALLESTPSPSDEQIVAAMSQNYCRCGCYVRIKAAVAQAARQMARAEEGAA